MTYVREISFVVPSSLPIPLPTPAPNSTFSPPAIPSTTPSYLEPPKLIMATTNLTLSYILQCRESITYLPTPWPPSAASSSSPSPSASSSAPTTTIPSQQHHKPRHPLSHPSLPSSTLFSQSALIFSTGSLASLPYPPPQISLCSPIPPQSLTAASTGAQRLAGRRVEKWSAQRFRDNAERGKGAMFESAEKVWRGSWRREGEGED